MTHKNHGNHHKGVLPVKGSNTYAFRADRIALHRSFIGLAPAAQGAAHYWMELPPSQYTDVVDVAVVRVDS